MVNCRTAWKTETCVEYAPEGDEVEQLRGPKHVASAEEQAVIQEVSQTECIYDNEAGTSAINSSLSLMWDSAKFCFS